MYPWSNGLGLFVTTTVGTHDQQYHEQRRVITTSAITSSCHLNINYHHYINSVVCEVNKCGPY